MGAWKVLAAMNASPDAAVNETPPDTFVSRRPRILLNESQSARVSLWRDGEAQGEEFPAEMIDISSGGTKLQVTTCLRFEESVRLRIEIPSVDLNCYVLASVRHIRPAGEGRWIVGCSVHPPLDEKAVARLAMQIGSDRRHFQRQPISMPVSVSRQLGLFDSDGDMINLSAGGFCIQLREPCTAGERIRVVLPDAAGRETAIMAGAQWQLKLSGGFLVGCKFLRAEDYHVVRAAAGEPVENKAEPAKPAEPEPSLWPAAALLACAPIAMVVLLETNWAPPAAVAIPPAVRQDIASPQIADEAAVGAQDSQPAAAEEDPRPASAAKAPGVGSNAAGDTPAGGAEPELREWTDSTGQFRVRAVLLAIDDGQVRLRREDGREVFVPIEKLSDADVAYVRGTGE